MQSKGRTARTTGSMTVCMNTGGSSVTVGNITQEIVPF